jgi:hypothetical protein
MRFAAFHAQPVRQDGGVAVELLPLMATAGVPSRTAADIDKVTLTTAARKGALNRPIAPSPQKGLVVRRSVPVKSQSPNTT